MESSNEDYLDVDKDIPGQHFCCVSFVSPEKIYKRRELFYTKKFIENLGISDIDNLDTKFDDFIHDKDDELQMEFQD